MDKMRKSSPNDFEGRSTEPPKVSSAKKGDDGEKHDKSSPKFRKGRSPERRFQRSGGPSSERSYRGSRRKDRSRDRNQPSSSSRRRRHMADKWEEMKTRHRRDRSRSSSSSRSSKSLSFRSCSRSSGDTSRDERIREREHRSRKRRSSEHSRRRSSHDLAIGDERNHESYKFETPTHTVLVKGLPIHLTENDIRLDVLQCGIVAKDIRVIRNRDTGVSRGFAFVEFNSVADGIRWMDTKKGILILHEQFEMSLHFSKPKFSDSYDSYRHKVTYGTNENINEDEISLYPTSRIILKNLDALTSKEDVLQAFQSHSLLAIVPIRSVKIIRKEPPDDTYSCCVQANNVSDATTLYTIFTNEIILINDRAVEAHYGKTFRHYKPKEVKAGSAAAAAVAVAQQWSSSADYSSTFEANSFEQPSQLACTEIKSMNDVEKMAQYSSSLYAKTAEEHESYLVYYRQYFYKELIKQSSTAGINSQNQTNDQLGHPHQSFRHWNLQDNDKQRDPVRRSSTIDTLASSSSTSESAPVELQKTAQMKDEDSQDKVQSPRTVAKEMEKWAKTLNQKKDRRDLYRPRHRLSDRASLPVPTAAAGASTSAFDVTSSSCSIGFETQSEYWGKNNSDQQQQKDAGFIDEAKLTCLLCKRKFTSWDVLQRHVEMSDLHKKNLQTFKEKLI